ncbi:dihydrodipicolinate synthase family protein [Micromonospora yasonensis]|uniref:dihydrodipicolinate synthase family protein n=1 Tax=Micromonospora yasonensis TaxID=1128667 RepID=UPI00222FE510|nr:dihydrodipicolinate synthase family protein [Micromonospora yasonensis]MCW3840695.1 dihydrodipicolinate synthase family protein [Micromonospora yasonensis]
MVSEVLPSGALVALATPVTAEGSLDEASLERLVDRVLTGGVVGIAPVGSTGEGPRLTTAQRLEITRRVVAQAGGLPVLPGVPVGSLEDARAELDQVGRLGARAALVAPPSFFPLTADEILRLYTRLADESPVPLVLYNIPAFSRAPLPVDVVAHLMHHPNIAGIKDSSRDLEYLQAVVTVAGEKAQAGEFVVYTGTDTMLVPSALAGAHGTIAASANLVPDLGVRILELMSSDLGRALELQRELTAIVSACRKGSPPAGWKAALHLVGVCSPYLVPPASHLPDAALDQMRGDLRAAGLLAEDT